MIISDDKKGAAAEEMLELLQDSDTPMRYRALAEACFSLEKGVDGYVGVYQKMLFLYEDFKQN